MPLLLALLVSGLAVPGLAAADWQGGLDALHAGDLDAAEKAFRQVVDQQPDWFGGHRMLGQTLLKAGRSGDAIQSLDRALALAPDDVATRFTLAQATLHAKQHGRALELLAGERPEGLPQAQWQTWLSYRSDAARAEGDLEAARGDLRDLAELGGADPERLYLLGHLEARLGDESAALPHLAAARRSAAKGSDTEVRALAMELRIRHAHASASEAGDREAACAALLDPARRLVKIDDSAASWSRAGRIAGCAGQGQQAIEWLEKAVQQGAEDWRTRYQLGRQLAFADRQAEAETLLSGLLGSGLDPAQARPTHDFLGYLLERQLRFDEAIDHYRLAGADAKIAAATESRRIHRENLAAEAETRRLEELERRLRELDKEAEGIGHGLL